MRIALAYFGLECKKSIKVLGSSIICMMLMLLILIAGVAAVSYTLLQTPAFQKIKVAVVIPEEEQKVKIATRYISRMDSVKSVCDFEYMNQEKAMRELEEGNVSVMIEFPLNFYEDVYVGKNTPAIIYFPKERTLGSEVFQGLLTAGVSFLQISEAGVYATLDVASEYPVYLSGQHVGDYVAALYVDEVFEREDVFSRLVLSPTGKVGYVQYYFVSAMLLVLLMCGLNYGYLYQPATKSVEQKLRIYGVGPFKMTVMKITLMTGMLWFSGMILYLAGCIITSRTEIELVSFRVGAVGGLLLLCLLVAAYFHAVYAVAGSRQGTVLLLCFNLIMILCSGLLVPLAYFPAMVQSLGDWIPVTHWSRFCTEILFGKGNAIEWLPLGALFLGGCGIGVWALWKKG